MKLYRINTVTVVGLLLVIILFLASSCDIVRDLRQKMPLDRELEALFRDKRGDFETLVRMSDEDEKVIRISHDFTWVSGAGLSTDTGQLGFSELRWGQYKGLFKSLSLESGLDRGEDRSVWLVAFSRGLGVSGLSKGYLYSPVKRACQESNLDFPEAVKVKTVACKHLDGHWYLFLSR